MNATDRAYREYFQSEVPQALPSLPLNEPARRTPLPRTGRHYFMAASVAALLALGLWLSGTPSNVKPRVAIPTSLLPGAQADGNKWLDASTASPLKP